MSETAPLSHEEPKSNRVPVYFQMLCMIISIVWMGYVIHKSLEAFQPTEPSATDIIVVTPPIYRQLGGFATFVTIGLYIDQFHTFDITNNLFIFSGYLWFRYPTGALLMQHLEQFSLLQGDIIERSPADVKLADGQMLVTFHIKAKFSSPLNYKNFPFDDHRLRITFLLKYFSPEEVLLDSSVRDFIVKPDLSSRGWHQVAQDTSTGYIKSSIDAYDKRDDIYNPAAMFIIDYDGIGYRLVMSILLPLLLIFYITLFGFSLDDATALRNATGSVTGLLGYRFVIDHLSPSVALFHDIGLHLFPYSYSNWSCINYFYHHHISAHHHESHRKNHITRYFLPST